MERNCNRFILNYDPGSKKPKQATILAIGKTSLLDKFQKSIHVLVLSIFPKSVANYECRLEMADSSRWLAVFSTLLISKWRLW